MYGRTGRSRLSSRTEFEQLISGCLQRLQLMLTNLLADSKVTAADVESVELVGGSSRIPAIKRVVAEVFGKEPKTTMNLDDTVARGYLKGCVVAEA